LGGSIEQLPARTRKVAADTTVADAASRFAGHLRYWAASAPQSSCLPAGARRPGGVSWAIAAARRAISISGRNPLGY